MQFLITDIGSEWTPTTVTHVVKHQGTTRVQSLAVPMINRKRTKAKIDYFTVDPGSSNNVLEVLVNDNVAPPKTLTITAVSGGRQRRQRHDRAGRPDGALHAAVPRTFFGTDMFQVLDRRQRGRDVNRHGQRAGQRQAVARDQRHLGGGR